MHSLEDFDINGKRVLVREDFNVPIQDGRITDDTRLKAGIPTLEHIVNHGGAAIVLSHFGRPVEGEFEDQYSLEPVANALSQLMGRPIRFEANWLEELTVESGEIVLCENVRFEVGEKKNDEALARKMANLGEVFVNDAFATAHRAQASTHCIARFAQVACAGPLLTAEIEALEATIKGLQESVAGPEFYSQEQDVVQSKLRELAEHEALLEERVERWSELEELQASLAGFAKP